MLKSLIAIAEVLNRTLDEIILTDWPNLRAR